MFRRSIARTQSLVRDLPGFTASSHTGYITVDKQTNSNLFFWFVLAEVPLAIHLYSTCINCRFLNVLFASNLH